ncbi:MAG: hypothetical protein LBN02_02225 [Oscillospiraceae bacterium]|jgi:MFS family permease|nr:hypothetical protein [Oscillospiraceae bacterium]
MTNVEQLISRFAKIPRIEETGPQHGYNGKRMARLGLRTRLIHAALCVIGLVPLVLYLFGADVSRRLIAVGFGLIVPGGGFMACGGPLTMAAGIYVCFWLWRKRAMMWQDFYGSLAGIVGFWAVGALGGLLAFPWWDWLVAKHEWAYKIEFLRYQWWGWILAIVCAVILFGKFELQVKKMYKEMAAARDERLPTFDDAIAELDAATAAPANALPDELDAEQLKAARFLLDTAVNREDGDFTGFDWLRGLAEYRYQLSAFGYGLMIMRAKYLPNFEGYLKQAHRFLIRGYADPRTCGYWAKEALTGYGSRNPDPVVKANVMLSGWMMPVVAGYHDQYGDDEFEREASIKFRPNKDKPDETYDYNSAGIMQVLYRQFAEHEYPYMLIPCEPHVAFPTCNGYGLLGMLLYDRDHGTHFCADFWDELYDNVSSEFIEIDGSMALRRQYQYGLRHLPASQLGYNPMADVQNYLHFLPIFPGLARRCYALVRKNELEIRDGAAHVKKTPWDKMIDMFTFTPNPSLQIATLAMTAAEYGDTELTDALNKTEEMQLTRSKEPNSFKFQNVNSLTGAYLAFSKLCKKGYWSDVILRGVPETAKTGPVLTDCAYPDVIPAKACSSGEDLELVLYDGAGAGDFPIKIERLHPDTRYTVNGGSEFTSDAGGAATLTVHLDGRTPLHIVKAG